MVMVGCVIGSDICRKFCYGESLSEWLVLNIVLLCFRKVVCVSM